MIPGSGQVSTPGAAAFPWCWGAVVLSVVLLSSRATAQGEATYPDVAADAYYAVAVQTLGADGVFDGTLCEVGFCPDELIDRKTMSDAGSLATRTSRTT